MKLTRKHIGKLFDVQGGDGGWCYQLVDVKKGHLLFYSFRGEYWIEKIGQTDWQVFIPQKFSKEWLEGGWKTGRMME